MFVQALQQGTEDVLWVLCPGVLRATHGLFFVGSSHQNQLQQWSNTKHSFWEVLVDKNLEKNIKAAVLSYFLAP